ncbi:hypothetical protein BX666DRAFT_1965500 [Dichotomocladium elegans]|nr:hypothetical protein BX666DRAFT_1965500 [Dichotomocladium elegans]
MLRLLLLLCGYDSALEELQQLSVYDFAVEEKGFFSRMAVIVLMILTWEGDVENAVFLLVQRVSRHCHSEKQRR